MKTHPHTLAALCLLVLAAAIPVHAFNASEDFSSYTPPVTFNTTSLSTTPGAGTAGTGATGNGWLTGWRTASSNVTATGVVTNATQINGGANYLAATITASSSNTSLNNGSFGRAYDAAGGGLATAPAVNIQFDFRVDSVPSTMRFDLFENRTRDTGASSATYNFRTSGGFWNYFNGASSVATTLAFTAGTVYTFNITLNPVASTYSFTLSDGTTSVSASAIAFRTAGFTSDATEAVGGRWLLFNSSETADVASQSTTFSLDNISVSAVPEPSAFAALAGLATLGLVTSSRRRSVR